jgi:hypothetical protein
MEKAACLRMVMPKTLLEVYARRQLLANAAIAASRGGS